MTIAYRVGFSGETIVFSEKVLSYLEANRQRHWWQHEAGGLLFAKINEKQIVVEEATGPHRKDWRSRFSFSIDQNSAQQEIDGRFELGLHYIGEWHSHPEPVPSPSGRDKRTMKSRVQESKHQLAGFVFAIIGQHPLPLGLTVIVHDGTTSYGLSADDTNVLRSP